MNTRLIIAIITSLIDEAIIIALILWGLPKLGLKIPPWISIVVAILFAIYAVSIFQLGTRILKKKPEAGLTDMTGLEGTVINTLNPDGFIKIEGEIWEARAESGYIKVGTNVIVVSQRRLKLIVKPTNKPV